MILRNPTDSDLTIKFNGIEYSLGANAEKEIPDDVAVYWRTKLHQFLQVVKPEVKEVEVVVKEPKKEEEKEEDKKEEELPEVKPKKEAKPKAK